MALRSWGLVAAILFFCACTQRTIINYMASDADRAFAFDFVAKMRAGDEVGLRPMFDAAVWPPSRPQIGTASRQFPSSGGRTDLIGFHVNQEVSGSGRRTAQFVLMTDDGRRWTRTTIVTALSGNGPQRVVGWNVVSTDSMPEDYRRFLRTEVALPWVQVGVATVLIALGVALFRRRRRRLLDAENVKQQ